MLRHFLLLGLLLLAPAFAAAADEHLATPKLAKAAVACQKVIAQVGAKVLAAKLKALDACANAALACVETKHDKPDCLAKAGSTCGKQLAKAVETLAKSEAKIVGAKSCSIELRLPDLLSADGLGLGDLAGDCQTDFGLDVCSGPAAVAACLVRTRDRAAGEIFGEARPRTAELLTLPNITLPPVAGLPAFTGCGTCGAPVERRKAVELCGKAITKARQGLGAGLEKTLVGCAQKVLGCVQTKNDDPKCLVGATAGCDKAATKIEAGLAKFAAAIAKKCDAAAVDFAELGADSGLGLAALALTCTNAPTDAAGLAACLASRARCTTATLVRQAIGRTGAFAERGYLAGLADDAAATCAAPQGTIVTRAPRFFFGGISKFLKAVRRPLGAVNGSVVNGGRPPSSPGVGRGIIRLSAPSRFSFGGVGKIQFRYKTSAALSRGARAVDPPALMVVVQRSDATLDDHFEVPLDPNPAGAEVDDEIEVTYQDTIPGCAFTLALATRIDGVVSDYTPVPLVLDTAAPQHLVVTQILDESGDGAGHGLNDALGLATDQFRNVYVTGAASNNVLKRTDTGEITQIIGPTGDEAGHTLTFAYAASISGSDNVFVASHAAAPETYVFRVSSTGGFSVKDLDSTGDGTHAFSAAGGIATDTDETFYVTGAISDNVFKHVFGGGPSTQIIDAAGDGTHALSEPGGIAVDPATHDVYVAGRLSNNVFKIQAGSGLITQIIDANGDGLHGLGEPVDVAVDSASNVYVVGSATSNAFRITPGGDITHIIDATGDGNGAFAEPVAVATAGTKVYVLGGASSRRAFEIAGHTITEIIGPAGDGVHPLELPGDIATDNLGNVYVSDRANRVFQIAPAP